MKNCHFSEKNEKSHFSVYGNYLYSQPPVVYFLGLYTYSSIAELCPYKNTEYKDLEDWETMPKSTLNADI